MPTVTSPEITPIPLSSIIHPLLILPDANRHFRLLFILSGAAPSRRFTTLAAIRPAPYSTSSRSLMYLPFAIANTLTARLNDGVPLVDEGLVLFGYFAFTEFCEKYAKPEDIGAAQDEDKSSEYQLSEGGYVSSDDDDEVAGKADP